MSLWNYISEILGVMIIKYDTPSFQHDFDFIAENNHTVNCVFYKCRYNIVSD